MPETPTLAAFADVQRRILADLDRRCRRLVVVSLTCSAMIVLTGLCALWAVESRDRHVATSIFLALGGAFIAGNCVALVRLAHLKRESERIERHGWTRRDALLAARKRPRA